MPKTDKIRAMFDGIAPGYDRLNHLMSLGVDRSWRRRALKEILTPGKEQRILDIACGTGDFSLAIARRTVLRDTPYRAVRIFSEGRIDCGA